MPSCQEFVVVARILRPQGRHGEVLAEILTDFPEKFAERSKLWLGQEKDAQPREYSLTNHWFHKGRVVLKFEGIESISDAEALTGSLVQIPREERADNQAQSAQQTVIGNVPEANRESWIHASPRAFASPNTW